MWHVTRVAPIAIYTVVLRQFTLKAFHVIPCLFLEIFISFAWLTRHPSPFEIHVSYSSFLPGSAQIPSSPWSSHVHPIYSQSCHLTAHDCPLLMSPLPDIVHGLLTYLCVFHNNGLGTFLKRIGYHFLLSLLFCPWQLLQVFMCWGSNLASCTC